MANVINNSKACLFNLIVFCQAEQCSIFLRTYINQLSQKFPFRLINIELSTDSKIKDIDVKQGSNAEDQIFITTPKKHLKDVPLLILPYLIPDLPIYLLWGEDPTEENNIFPEALKYSSRVIFDSSTPDDLQKFARKLTNLHKDSQIGLIDLNWARSSAWRNALANTFDNQERLAELKKADKIEISYATNKHDSNVHSARQAIYLQAWLATQLKWKFEDIKIGKDKAELTYQRQKENSVIIELKAKHHDSFAAGEIIELEIESPNQQSYSLCRKEGQPQICVHVSTSETCELPCNLTIPSWKKGSQIVTEVFYQNPSQHYLHMLQLLAKIDWRSL